MITAHEQTVDLAAASLRAFNAALHALGDDAEGMHWRVLNPRGAHAIAVGLDVSVVVEIDGHVGYYCAGMNKKATIVVNGNAGPGHCSVGVDGGDHSTGIRLGR